MEDMRPIFMHIDALNILAIDISAQMWSLIYYQTSFALLMGKVGECGSEETGTHNEIVVSLVVHILVLILMIDECFCKDKEF